MSDLGKCPACGGKFELLDPSDFPGYVPVVGCFHCQKTKGQLERENIRNIQRPGFGRTLAWRFAWDFLDSTDTAVNMKLLQTQGLLQGQEKSVDDIRLSSVEWVHEDSSRYDIGPLERACVDAAMKRGAAARNEAKDMELSRKWGDKFGASPKQCWLNCVKVLRRISKVDGDYLYVEGFARLKSNGVAVEHGWIEAADGTIIDPTIHKDDLDYFPGVRYTKSQVLGYKRRQPPYVWGREHGFGGFRHPEYRKAHDTAWSLLMGKVGEARSVIDSQLISEMPIHVLRQDLTGRVDYPGPNMEPGQSVVPLAQVKQVTVPAGSVIDGSQEVMRKLVEPYRFTPNWSRPEQLVAFSLLRRPEDEMLNVQAQHDEHGFYVLVNPEEKVRLMQAIQLIGKRQVSKAMSRSRGVIDSLAESPYYYTGDFSSSAREWASRNKVNTFRADPLQIVNVSYHSAPELFKDVKWTSSEAYNNFENLLALVSTKQSDEELHQVRMKWLGMLCGLYYVLCTKRQWEDIMREVVRKNVEAAADKRSQKLQGLDFPQGETAEQPPLGEELLVEMPQYTTGRPSGPKVVPEERYSVNCDVYSGTGFSVKVYAILPDGTNRQFVATEPFSPEIRREWQEAKAAHPHDWYRHDEEFRKKVMNSIDSSEMYKRLARRAANDAWRWIDQEKAGQQFVKMKGIKRVFVKFDIKPLIQGFRYIRHARSSTRSVADAIAFAQLKQPEDELVRLLGPESSKGGVRFEYYVLMNQKEKALFKSRVLDANRALVTGAMRRGVEAKIA